MKTIKAVRSETTMPNEIIDVKFYDGIKKILSEARQKVYAMANFAMVEAYWEIGKSIVEKQSGNATAEYGEGLIKKLAGQRTKEFGKGFTTAKLKNRRQFYLAFPNRYTLCSRLSWLHNCLNFYFIINKKMKSSRVYRFFSGYLRAFLLVLCSLKIFGA